MKPIIFLSFYFISNLLFSQAPTTPVEAKKDSVKTVETKTPAKDAASTSQPAAPKKELPPLQKDGGFMVLGAVKWQAENIQKKSYMLAKEECEKNGMRLPTRDELVDAYFSKYPEFRSPAGNYLSGTRVASNRSMLWYVNFDNGHHNHGVLTRDFNVRCVKADEKKAEVDKKSEAEKKVPEKK